jgi:rhodanese-related sulfurtransferase
VPPGRLGRALPLAALAPLAGLALMAGLAAGGLGCRSSGTADPDRPPAFRRVTPPVAFEMLRDAPYLAIVDLRPADAFRGPLGHINGARSVPMGDLAVRYLELLDLREQTFLVYCGSRECNGEIMEFLIGHGFEDAVLIDGGIEAWLADGFGTVDQSDGVEAEAAGGRRRHRRIPPPRTEMPPPPPARPPA